MVQYFSLGCKSFVLRTSVFPCPCLQRYSLEITEWNGKEWQPYQADDVQLQFYMMSPYVLKTLSHDSKVLISLVVVVIKHVCMF